MQYVTLGRTDIQVSNICLGTMTWGKQNNEADAHEQLDYALDQGINFIDTAEMYAVPPSADTYGKTETYIGTWLKNRPDRDKIILATKIAGGGMDWVRGGAPLSGKGIRIAIEDSLKRLQTDYVDLYQLHWTNRASYHFDRTWSFTPAAVPASEIEDHFMDCLTALNDLVKAGKIRHAGLSNETAWGTMKWVQLAEKHGLPRMQSIQNEYSLLRRLADLDLAEVCAFEDVSFLPWSPLATGILSGKYIGGVVPEGSRRSLAQRHNHRKHPIVDTATERYVALARQHGLDPSQMALAFVMQQPFVASTIIGATSMHQLKADIAAQDVTLSPEVLDGIAAIHRELPIPY
jgi:aryl-alcohol dehydrogenase-like predicted oxidoreductase